MGAIVAPYLFAGWFASRWSGLVGGDLWILRGLLAGLGILVAVVAFKWLRFRRAGTTKPGRAEHASTESVDTRQVIDSVLRSAGVISKWLRFAKYRGLPRVLLLGRIGAGKTSVVEESGLARAWLAGDGESPSSSRWVNCWFASGTIFTEAAGRLLGDTAGWQHLLVRLRPRRIESILGKGERAATAIIVCISLAEPVQAESDDPVLSTAEWLGQRLREASAQLGVSFPVYVVFTGMDKLRGFEEFGRHLSEHERGQVFGVTLPLPGQNATGLVASDQLKNLGNAFDDLFYSLCDQRTRLLSLEIRETSRYAIYEFPRELWKLRSSLIPALARVCARSALGSGPFLRGFYFSASPAVHSMLGESHDRARTLIDMDRVEGLSPQDRTWLEAHLAQCDACARFSSSTRQAVEAVACPQIAVPPDLAVTSRRRVRQSLLGSSNVACAEVDAAPDDLLLTRDLPVVRDCVHDCSRSFFLHRLFADTVLKDHAVRAFSGFNHRVSAFRRLVLISGCAAFLICAVGFGVSYLRNLALEDEALQAVQILETGANSGSSLEGLEQVRRFLDDKLAPYVLGGPPRSYAWGLYAGRDLDRDLKGIYFRRFRALLLDPASQSMQTFLETLPNEPAPGQDFDPAYAALKAYEAYLMTTSHPDKTDAAFLADALTAYWAKALNEGEPGQIALAHTQFLFYARQLRLANPYPDRLADPASVAQGRNYLAHFLDARVVYQALLARVEADSNIQSVDFGRQYSNWQSVFTQPPVVPPAFTPPGWAAMQRAIAQSSSLFHVEDWVLNQPAPREDDLRNLYRADYASQWLGFLHGTSVRSFGSRNVGQALRNLTDSRSPLLELLCVAAANTNEDGVRVDFQPVQSIVEAGGCANQPVSEKNRAYVDALRGLQAAYQNPGNDPVQASQARQTATLATRSLEDGFQWQAPSARDVQRLIESPLGLVPAPVNPETAALNAAAARFCSQPLFNELPFRPAGSEATLSDFDTVFNLNQGTLWTTLYHASGLDHFLTPNGVLANPAPADSGPHLDRRLVGFFSRAALISRRLYPSPSSGPRLSYSITAYPSDGIQSVDLVIDGKQLRHGSTSPAEFVWPGSGEGVTLTATFPDGSKEMRVFPGVWGVFRFLGAADKSEAAGASHRFEWTLRPQVGREAGRAYHLGLSVDPGDVFAAVSAFDCSSSAASR